MCVRCVERGKCELCAKGVRLFIGMCKYEDTIAHGKRNAFWEGARSIRGVL